MVFSPSKSSLTCRFLCVLAWLGLSTAALARDQAEVVAAPERWSGPATIGVVEAGGAPALGSSDANVFDEDDRRTDDPETIRLGHLANVARLEGEGQFLGTAALVHTPFLMLTAAHTLFEVHDGRCRPSVAGLGALKLYFPELREGDGTLKRRFVTRVYVPWASPSSCPTRNGRIDEDWDVALLVLDRPVYGRLPFYLPFDEGDVRAKPLRVYGYHVDINGGWRLARADCAWHGDRGGRKRILKHDCDTQPGVSGGPIVYGGNGTFVLGAVHLGGGGLYAEAAREYRRGGEREPLPFDPETNFNRAVMVDADLARFIAAMAEREWRRSVSPAVAAAPETPLEAGAR